MPIFFSNEDYDGLNSLVKNAGDWVPGEVSFSLRFSRGSGFSNKCTYHELGSLYWLQFDQGNWDEDGFLPGDPITLIWEDYTFAPFPPPPIYPGPRTANSVVDYLDGSIMYLTAPLVTATPFISAIPAPFVWPVDSVRSGVLVVANRVPESFEFFFNLTKNGLQSMGSVLDGEITRFEFLNNPALIVGGSAPLTQMLSKSGSYIKDVVLHYDATPGDFMQDYRITYKFWQWGVIKAGFPEPNYYDAADHLAPIVRVRAYGEYGNPNSAMQFETSNTEANTGGFDENYNGGINNYTVISTEWFDQFANEIDALDYSNPCDFVSIISAPNQNNPLSIYNIGLVWRPIDPEYYANAQNNTNGLRNIGENLMLNAPEVDFIADGVTDVTVYPGLEREDGSKWDITNIKIEITGVDEITVSGTVIPNQEANDFFETLNDGERKSTLWLSIGNHNLTPNTDDRVSLKLFDADNYDAPTIGVQHPYVLNEFLIDHGFVDITAADPATTTEDDVLYKSLFQFEEGKQYEGLRYEIGVFNTLTDDYFKLEGDFFDFETQPFIAGVHELNMSQPRNFNLPPTTDRNEVKLYRDPNNDAPGLYALQFDYGFLNDWRYWEEQANAENAFFVFGDPQNGKNKDWQHYSLPPEWQIRISYYPRFQGVDDFNHFLFSIRPYEDEDADTTWTYTQLSTGLNPTNFVNNEEHLVEAAITWNIADFSPGAWCEMTVEDYENGNRWLISNILAQGNVTNNPLKQYNGPGLEVTFPATNIASLKAILDTNLINAPKISLSARISSPGYPWLTTIGGKQARNMIHSFATKWTPPSVYNGPLIQVRNALGQIKDIPYTILGGFYVLDEADLLNHTGNQVGDFGWVTARYDQSGADFHQKFSSHDQQPPIVIDGVIVRDPDTNRPSALYNGTTHYGTLPPYIQQQNKATAISVFNRVTNEDENSGYGYDLFGNPVTLRWRANGVIESGFGSLLHTHSTDAVSTGAQLVMTYREPFQFFPISFKQYARKNGVDLSNFVDDTSVPTPFDRLDKNGPWLHKGYKTDDFYLVTTGNTPVELETIVNAQAGVF